jgi:hypothetical protein
MSGDCSDELDSDLTLCEEEGYVARVFTHSRLAKSVQQEVWRYLSYCRI